MTIAPQRRPLRARLTAAVAVLATSAVVTATAAFAVEPAHAAGTTKLGIYNGGLARTQTAEFEAWLGRTADVVQAFSPGGDWADVEGRDWFINHWRDSPYRDRMFITIPMLTNDTTTTLAKGAAGQYDAHYRTLATKLVAAGMEEATLRIGHEFNGSWYRWAAHSEPGNYAAYYRRIVTAMRSVSGQKFRFDWNVSLGIWSWDARLAWPGDAYVDSVSMDFYDGKWGDTDATPQEIWQHLLYGDGTYKHGLEFWAAFAAQHGKDLGVAEWGVVDKWASMTQGGGGGDNPYFIEQVHKWLQAKGAAYAIYFNQNAPDGKHKLGDPLFPNATAKYRELFGAAPATSTPTTTTPAPTPTTTTPAPTPTTTTPAPTPTTTTPAPTTTTPAPTPTTTTPAPSPTTTTPAPSPTTTTPATPDVALLVSKNAKRNGASRLQGASLSGDVYVFATVNAPVRAVRFYIDDPMTTRSPFSTDYTAVHDLFASAGDPPQPLLAGSLGAGTHTVTVVAALYDGRTVQQSATFQVSGAGTKGRKLVTGTSIDIGNAVRYRR